MKDTVIACAPQRTFGDKDKSYQNKLKLRMKSELNALFKTNNLKPADIVTFLRDYEKDICFEERESRTCREAIHDQFNQLSQGQKRVLIPLLTHRDGRVNADVTAALPFLSRRSEELLENPVRKERADKINLDFISEFMHEHCR